MSLFAHPSDGSVVIDHVPAARRFEARVHGRRVAALRYRISGPAAVLTDTTLAPDEDPGCRTSLIDAALDALVRSGFYAVALCPHVRAYLQAHPERRVGVDARFLDTA